MNPFIIGVIILLGIIVLFIATMVISLVGAYVKALFNGATVPMSKLVALKLASIPYGMIVDARITAVRAGIPVSADQIASHYQAGGNVVPTIQALIAAKKAGILLDWDRACAIDLATKGSGKSVVEAVRTSVDPKVIDCPNPEQGRTTIDGVAKDGIQVKVKARVTVRTHLDRFVGGAKENTIIARVGEGIVTTIGGAESYKGVLENPDSISKTVLARGLDAGTAFEILSIDIADVDVGENIGARLQVAQAEANKNMAQAQAEIRRAAAVALEQEMKARVQEMQAKVVESQAQVPLAMAEAFRNGRLGVMDYYRMQNIQSDTDMRTAIAQPESGKK
jgi:uncharacterized protein YqfA (UPF0365 family)